MNYQALVASIRQVHDTAQSQVARAVNRSLVLRNWVIGAYLVEFEQNGEDRAAYGTGLLKQVAKDLKKSGISGCSRQMLDHMRLFYTRYPQISTVICPPAVGISGSKDSDSEKSSPLVSLFTALDLPIRQPQFSEPGADEKDQMMQPGDQAPVGLLLCADKDQPRVDYATAGLDHQLFVSRYLNQLPSVETLQNLIEHDTATWLQVREEATSYNANPK